MGLEPSSDSRNGLGFLRVYMRNIQGTYIILIYIYIYIKINYININIGMYDYTIMDMDLRINHYL